MTLCEMCSMIFVQVTRLTTIIEDDRIVPIIPARKPLHSKVCSRSGNVDVCDTLVAAPWPDLLALRLRKMNV
jgi:hypothetical protein